MKTPIQSPSTTPIPLDIPYILKQADLRPNKSLGQNFLSDPNILSKIVYMAGVTRSDRVLEIGPGLGSLTRSLAACAQSVTAVEIDKKLFPVLSSIMAGYSNVQLILGDMLKLRPEDIMHESGYLVVANIPYYITSALIRHLLESSCQPVRIVLTVQNEVAQRICASDGDYNLLGLSVQVYGKPEIVMKIPSGAFYPPPKVDSAVVRISLYSDPVIPVCELDQFFLLIKAGFSQKRKTLRNSLAGGLKKQPAEVEKWLKNHGIDPMRRAETLALEEWQTLTSVFKKLA
jgi:16S rRNA (adenine1518-N6/adenine1519-N6)-dimethyltransferase